jgi:phosphotransferase system HPr (HPr) family protein
LLPNRFLEPSQLDFTRLLRDVRRQPVQDDRRLTAMPERRLVVIDPAGLHARPAARFVQVASRFTSSVTIRVGERTADAKSLIAVLGLTIRPATEIALTTAGADAELALDTLTAELGPYLASAPAGAVPAVVADPEPA